MTKKKQTLTLDALYCMDGVWRVPTLDEEQHTRQAEAEAFFESVDWKEFQKSAQKDLDKEIEELIRLAQAAERDRPFVGVDFSSDHTSTDESVTWKVHYGFGSWGVRDVRKNQKGYYTDGT